MPGLLHAQTIIRRSILLIAALLLVVCITPKEVFAAATNTTPAARVTFTFDDGMASAFTKAAPVLQRYGLSGTNYITTSCIGMTTAPNSCGADTERAYMTWGQVTTLQNTYGWEIGSHTVTHPCLASSNQIDPATCRNGPLTTAQIRGELTNSKSALAARGFTATAFAPPYGDYNNTVMKEAAKFYSSMRGFRDEGMNVWPYNEYLLNNIPIQETIHTVDVLKAQIDEAIRSKSWLILTFHDIADNPSQDPEEYQYGTAELDQVAAYVKNRKDAGLLSTGNVSSGPVTSDSNLLPNSSFNSAFGGNGWTTDNPAAITRDTATNGSFPDPTNSAKFVAGSTNAHLFSPKVPVKPAETYLLKAFTNVVTRTGSEFAYYIDEYDAAGNWISGQYKIAERDPFVENLNFTYKPSSLAVGQASLQIILPGNSGISAYVDNVQWFSLTASEPQPEPDPNMLANGKFDQGLSGGWTTDSPGTMAADSGNHGSPANPVNSLSLTSNTTNRHLFSPRVNVVTSGVYTVSSYVNVTARANNEVGFYIDEYDANGNWISGQYKAGVRETGIRTIMFNYTPSSAAVRSASLQVIMTANSGIHAYFDDAKWLQN